MLLSKAEKILKKEFGGGYCTVEVKTNGHEIGVFTWSVYADNYHIHSGPSFRSALNSLLDEINPKRVKTHDVEIDTRKVAAK